MNPADPAEVIAAQTVVIANLLKLQQVNQGLVQKIVDALRIFMLDMQALGVAVRDANEPIVAPPPRDPNVLSFKKPIKPGDPGVN
jgi:hypothetical protein